MITPSPTTPVPVGVARGVLLGISPETATRPATVHVGIPNTSYELHLRPTAEVSVQTGKRLLGVIRVDARRIDPASVGGRFIEPVMGRPRRVQGVVVAHEGDAVVVDAGTPIHLRLTDARQKPQDIPLGQLIGCDVLDGATLTPR